MTRKCVGKHCEDAHFLQTEHSIFAHFCSQHVGVFLSSNLCLHATGDMIAGCGPMHAMNFVLSTLIVKPNLSNKSPATSKSCCRVIGSLPPNLPSSAQKLQVQSGSTNFASSKQTASVGIAKKSVDDAHPCGMPFLLSIIGP